MTMSSYLVLTATGRDRPGIVEAVTERIVAHEGNVEVSRMARLGGEFALLALVTVPAASADALVDAFRGLEAEGLAVSARPTEPAEGARYDGYAAYDVEVSGADHAGIVHEVTHYLAEQGINIENMETDVSAAPLSGAPLFTMNAVVFAPTSLSLRDIRASLDDICAELGVDSDVAPHRGA
jgi:glycine cleavage system transcriptional repressor